MCNPGNWKEKKWTEDTNRIFLEMNRIVDTTSTSCESHDQPPVFDWYVMKTTLHTHRTHALVRSKSTQDMFSTEARLIQRSAAGWPTGHFKCEEMGQRPSNSTNGKPGLFAIKTKALGCSRGKTQRETCSVEWLYQKVQDNQLSSPEIRKKLTGSRRRKQGWDRQKDREHWLI